MEASSGAHHWARKLAGFGLDARIMAAHLVTPYRLQGKGGKNDANDAAAVCEAATQQATDLMGVGPITASAVVAPVGGLSIQVSADFLQRVKALAFDLALFGQGHVGFGKCQPALPGLWT